MVIIKVSILGTDYTIEFVSKEEDKYMKDNSLLGYCSFQERKIIILDIYVDDYFSSESDKFNNNLINETLRHEVIHAFLSESGLQQSSLTYQAGWASNEEMVDWIAIQFPKILKVYKELDCI